MLEIKSEVRVDGTLLSNFETIQLHQVINEPHYFEIAVDHDIVAQTGSHTIEDSMEWLGKPIVIVLGEMEFLGTITDLGLEHSSNYLKLSEKVTYEATHENLNFISNKNINFKGNHSE